MADLAVFVKLVHPIITFVLRNNLACILDDDLVRLKATIAPDTIPAIEGFYDLNPDVILTASLCSLSELFKAAVRATLCSDVTIGVVAFVEHEPVETLLIAPILRGTDASR